MDVLFVMEQHIGHLAFYQNLRTYVEQTDQVRPIWTPVTYQDKSSLWNRLPGFPQQLRGSLIGRSQVLSGLQKSEYQVAFSGTPKD